jgi:hypothetical protein
MAKITKCGGLKRMKIEPRELTRYEKTSIKRLVTTLCASYCKEYGCLLLDDGCVMLIKCWTGGGCKYFRNAVLPNDPVLEAALIQGKPMKIRHCAVCGNTFQSLSNNAKYCGSCAKSVHRKQKAMHARKRRSIVEK